jgi:uncharacterized membrane protein YfcA
LAIKYKKSKIVTLYSLYFTKGRHLKEDSMFWLFVCRFLSGIFSGAYGVNGPPLLVYGNLRQWSARYFRATLQAYVLPVSLISIIGYYSKCLITSEVNAYFFHFTGHRSPELLFRPMTKSQAYTDNYF